MTAGKAKGRPREYQELCRDALLQEYGGSHYAGDGIDVLFHFGGIKWTADVALKDSRAYPGALLIAECKSHVSKARPQGEVMTLAQAAEHLRETLGVPVAAFFMANRVPQRGALRYRPRRFPLGVILVTGTDFKNLPAAKVAFLRYDPHRKKTAYDYRVHQADEISVADDTTVECDDDIN